MAFFSIFPQGSHSPPIPQGSHGPLILRLIEEVYRYLPLASIVNTTAFVVHGGISDHIDLEKLEKLDRSKVTFFFNILIC